MPDITLSAKAQQPQALGGKIRYTRSVGRTNRQAYAVVGFCRASTTAGSCHRLRRVTHRPNRAANRPQKAMSNFNVGMAMSSAIEEQKQATPIGQRPNRYVERHGDGHPNHAEQPLNLAPSPGVSDA
jgi:hypothetical protein